jgi:hypothetical protein
MGLCYNSYHCICMWWVEALNFSLKIVTQSIIWEQPYYFTVVYLPNLNLVSLKSHSSIILIRHYSKEIYCWHSSPSLNPSLIESSGPLHTLPFFSNSHTLTSLLTCFMIEVAIKCVRWVHLVWLFKKNKIKLN